MEEDLDYQNEKLKLEISKLEAEVKKIEIENKELNRFWLRKPQWVAALSPLILATATIIVATSTGFLNTQSLLNKNESIMNRIDADSLQRKKDLLSIKNDSLGKIADSLKQLADNLGIKVNNLNEEKDNVETILEAAINDKRSVSQQVSSLIQKMSKYRVLMADSTSNLHRQISSLEISLGGRLHECEGNNYMMREGLNGEIKRLQQELEMCNAKKN